MRRCPFCAEEIQDQTIICAFCNRSLAEGQANGAVSDVVAPRPDTSTARPKWGLLTLIGEVVLTLVSRCRPFPH
jgi:hypothetical protein